MNALNQLFSKIGQLLNWWVTVAPWEQALRVRLGAHVDKLGPGIHVRIPWVDRIYRQSVRLRTADFDGDQTITTADDHILTVRGNVKYQIDDLQQLYDTLHHAQDTIIDLVMGEIAEFVVTHNRSDVTPYRLREHVREMVDLEQYGFGNITINITDFAFAPAIRLIRGGERYTSGDRLNTNNCEGPTSSPSY